MTPEDFAVFLMGGKPWGCRATQGKPGVRTLGKDIEGKVQRGWQEARGSAVGKGEERNRLTQLGHPRGRTPRRGVNAPPKKTKRPARSHDQLTNRAQERDANGDLLCPICDKSIRPDDSTGSVDGKVAHLACWLKRRQEARRARLRPKS
jgi:hypothetical protein